MTLILPTCFVFTATIHFDDDAIFWMSVLFGNDFIHPSPFACQDNRTNTPANQNSNQDSFLTWYKQKIVPTSNFCWPQFCLPHSSSSNKVTSPTLLCYATIYFLPSIHRSTPSLPTSFPVETATIREGLFMTHRASISDHHIGTHLSFVSPMATILLKPNFNLTNLVSTITAKRTPCRRYIQSPSTSSFLIHPSS